MTRRAEWLPLFTTAAVILCIYIQTAELTYTNLAENKPVYSSSTYPYDGTWCCDESLAVDGNYDTSWQAENDVTTVNFVIDFEQPEKFSLLEIYWDYDNHALMFEIAISNDSFHWTVIHKENNAYYQTIITDLKVESRYLMINGFQPYNSYKIYEIQVYRECSDNTECGDGICCVGEGICSLSCPSSSSNSGSNLCSSSLCYEGECQEAFKVCSDDDPYTRDMCNKLTGECESDVPICGLNENTFADESQWDSTGVGEYGASVTITPTLITIISGNGGSGSFVTMTCYYGSGIEYLSSSYSTLDWNYTYDYPFYSVDGVLIKFNPNEINSFKVTFETEVCFGLYSTDLLFGAATWQIGFDNYYQCDDGIACTEDLCNIETGECSYNYICEIDDGNICTADYCLLGSCYSTAACDDYTKCTDDYCDSLTAECSFIPITSCDDQSVCTNEECEPTRGCVYQSILCDDNDECTSDSCDTINGCEHQALICDDNDDCTVDRCDSAIGCINTLLNCNDNNVCTVDSCNKSTNCLNVAIDCSDGKNCTVDSCNPTFPEGNQCVHHQMSCFPSNQCFESVCNETTISCVETSKNCDDDVYCTIDSCDITSGCKHIARNCNDSNVCTLDSCNNDKQRCDNLPLNCNDDNLCTADSCSPTSGCIHTTINCDDSNACTLDQCSPQKGCTHTPISCDDGNLCTSDTCNSATGCVHSNICSATGCTSVSDCNFGTTNGCDDVSCAHGACLRKISDCDDGNVCTSDSCLSGRCFHVKICN